MKPNFNTVSHIKQRVSSFYEDIKEKKLEILISSLYESTYYYYWHPILDFDTYLTSEVKTFIVNEIKNLESTYVELTKNGFHIISNIAYGPLEKNDINELKLKIKKRFGKEYTGFDWRMCLVQTPIRRTFCYYLTPEGRGVVACVKSSDFLDMNEYDIKKYKETFLDKVNSKTFNSIIDKVLFPTKTTEYISNIFKRL